MRTFDRAEMPRRRLQLRTAGSIRAVSAKSSGPLGSGLPHSSSWVSWLDGRTVLAAGSPLSNGWRAASCAACCAEA